MTDSSLGPHSSDHLVLHNITDLDTIACWYIFKIGTLRVYYFVSIVERDCPPHTRQPNLETNFLYTNGDREQE